MSTTKTKKAFDLKTSYVGTCQACFASQVVKATGGKKVHALVLHGYLRPGYGSIKGECWGVGHEPYELSCELTKSWKADCEKSLAFSQKRLADLLADLVESFMVSVPDYDIKVGRWENQPKKIVTLKRGEAFVDTKKSWNSVTFEEARKNATNDTKRRIVELTETIAFLGERIAAWKYAPEALVDHETVKRNERAAKDASKLAAGFRRDWKDSWKRIADAIRSHKDATDRLADNREYYKNDPAALERVEQRWMGETEGRRQPVAWGQLPAFPSNKERAAARARAK